MAPIGVRRAKAAFSSGCESHPASAPAGSNRSGHGGDEMAEAFGHRNDAQCPLWVISGHSAIPSPMSAFGGKADIGEGLIRNRDPNVRYWG